MSCADIENEVLRDQLKEIKALLCDESLMPEEKLIEIRKAE